MSFTVTRQSRWVDGLQVVEINQGGLDYANADMLTPTFRNLGEGETFSGMKEAVEAGIAIANKWQETAQNPIYIAIGNTHGMGLTLDEQEVTKDTCEDLLKRAEEYDENLPKCDHCGEILGKDTFTLIDFDDMKFCSEFCAEECYRQNQEDTELEEEEE